jgi:hypothetical protein
MAEQKKRRYRQFAGFPGASGLIEEGHHGPEPVKPLTDAERAEIERAGIPHDPQLPLPYTPPLDPSSRRIGIELLGPLGLAAIVLGLFTWLLNVPASGEHQYYGEVLSGEVTHVDTEGPGVDHDAAAE